MRITLLTTTFLLFRFILSAQGTNTCNNNAGGALYPSNTCIPEAFNSDANNDFWDSATGCGGDDVDAVWGYFTAASTSTTITYDPSTAGANPIIHLFTGGCAANMTSFACQNAAGNNGNESITIATTPGTLYRIRVQDDGSDADMDGTICVMNAIPVAGSSNTVCSTPNPICSGSPIVFTANAGGSTAHAQNPGNSYGCLSTTPNPSWYYMEIDQPGNLAINITAGSDVDFRLWGPFPNLTSAQASCNGYTNAQAVDCSYSISATEQANANGVSNGQVYVLLVTNYANTVQNISINEAGSNTASTNCAIVPLPVGYTVWDISVVNDDVILMWETESEHNNSHFLVQRSEDGLIWETVGLVEGNGSTETAHAYSFRDSDPILGVGYYRLNQIDTDGTSTITSMLAANTLKSKTLRVFPNPSKGLFNIQVDPKDISEICLTDVVGKAHSPEITDGGELIIVNTENLAKGIYTISAVVKGERIVQRIVIE